MTDWSSTFSNEMDRQLTGGGHVTMTSTLDSYVHFTHTRAFKDVAQWAYKWWLLVQDSRWFKMSFDLFPHSQMVCFTGAFLTLGNADTKSTSLITRTTSVFHNLLIKHDSDDQHMEKTHGYMLHVVSTQTKGKDRRWRTYVSQHVHSKSHTNN